MPPTSIEPSPRLIEAMRLSAEGLDDMGQKMVCATIASDDEARGGVFLVAVDMNKPMANLIHQALVTFCDEVGLNRTGNYVGQGIDLTPVELAAGEFINAIRADAKGHGQSMILRSPTFKGLVAFVAGIVTTEEKAVKFDAGFRTVLAQNGVDSHDPT